MIVGWRGRWFDGLNQSCMGLHDIDGDSQPVSCQCHVEHGLKKYLRVSKEFTKFYSNISTFHQILVKGYGTFLQVVVSNLCTSEMSVKED